MPSLSQVCINSSVECCYLSAWRSVKRNTVHVLTALSDVFARCQKFFRSRKSARSFDYGWNLKFQSFSRNQSVCRTRHVSPAHALSKKYKRQKGTLKWHTTPNCARNYRFIYFQLCMQVSSHQFHTCCNVFHLYSRLLMITTKKSENCLQEKLERLWFVWNLIALWDCFFVMWWVNWWVNLHNLAKR